MAAFAIEQALQLALAHHRAGRLAEAEPIYRQILAQEPTHAGALHLLGLIASATGHYEEALALIGRAIERRPTEPDFHSNLGETYRRLGQTNEAITCFRRAVALDPENAPAFNNLGNALFQTGQWDEAAACCRRALGLQPDFAEAHNNLGNVLVKKRDWEEAAACYRQALALKPDYVEAHYNLGNVLSEMGRWEEAITSCRRALALVPDHAEAHSNLGVALSGKGEFAPALQAFRQAVAGRADLAAAHWNLAVVLLRAGHYAEGWREYEWRWRDSFLPELQRSFSAPRWDGARVPGQTLLLHAEQGHGDTLHFLRYVPLVLERAATSRVIFECPAKLVRLISQAGCCGLEIVARHGREDTSLPPFDCHVPLLSLPLTLGLYEPLRSAGPYLRADPELSATWRARLAGDSAFRVGLAWAGSPAHKDDQRRSIDPEILLPLLRVPGVSFYSLQVEPRTAMPAGVIDLTAHLSDFAETAALMAELDLIITVDTATAHLAGALGLPVWTLLPFVPDWRWGLEREDTPWYPTMRLFRQRVAGDWDDVVQRVAVALHSVQSVRPMQTAPTPLKREFPPFSLTRLLTTVFNPQPGERVCILIDLEDPREITDFRFLQNPDLSIQRHAHDVFYQGLKNGGLAALGLTGGEIFAYEITSGSNLDLPEKCFAPDGRELSLVEDVYKVYDLVLCISTYSATAPLTAFAKKYDFRGATMHGMNQIILSTGLAVDYAEVSRQAEKLRLGMTRADWVEIDYTFGEQRFTLHVDLAQQEAQKSHGLCRGEPDIANLPAGEIYYVPAGVEGQFPMKYEDGTIGLMHVTGGRITKSTLLRGSQTTIDEHNAKLQGDPVTGEIGELGFGTQELPVSGRDIQDEKILGTLHVATGRSDHLGGKLTPDRFKSRKNATHDDILFAPHKTPEIGVPQARMHRNGETVVLIENFAPAAYLRGLLAE